MANYCWYQIRVKGKKKNAYMIYHTMPCCDDISILSKKGNDSDYNLIFSGNCKWSLDAYCDDSTDDLKINVDDFVDENGDLLKDVTKYWYYTLKDKSKIYNCEIEAFAEYEDYDARNDEGDRPTFEHYKNGEEIETKELSLEEAKKCANELFKLKTAIPDIYNTGVWLDLPDDYDEEDYSEDEDDEFDENLFPIQTELYHTDLNGGVERAEHYKVGDEVKLIQEYNAEDGYMGIRVEHELGFVGYTSCADEIIEIQNETNNEEPLAKIIEVQPLSQRSKRCKKPLVVIEIYLKENK